MPNTQGLDASFLLPRNPLKATFLPITFKNFHPTTTHKNFEGASSPSGTTQGFLSSHDYCDRREGKSKRSIGSPMKSTRLSWSLAASASGGLHLRATT
jgi:hypothetical protein